MRQADGDPEAAVFCGFTPERRVPDSQVLCRFDYFVDLSASPN
jgi:hypothetical protein